MKIVKFQEGGAAPAQQGQANPEEQLAQMAQQIIQQLGPEATAMLAQMLAQMLQEMQGGQGGEEQGQPVYARKGGKLVMLGRR
jgi:hypothetical protein